MPENLVRSVMSEIESHRRDAAAKKLRFTALDEPKLRARLSPPRSGGRVVAAAPMIVWQSWSSMTTPGGSITYNVGIQNPSATDEVWLFGHVFVGPANFVPEIGDAVQAVDARFPRLTEPSFAGLHLPANGASSLSFNLAVPTGIQPSNYIGNTLLFRADWHDVGDYLDRGTFIFGVGAV